MSNLVTNPILNSAFKEPARHHNFEAGKEHEVWEGRRPALYLMARAERKGGAARKWVEAVNNWGKLGPWAYEVVKNLAELEPVIDRICAVDPSPQSR